MTWRFLSLSEAIEGSILDLRTYGKEVDSGHWQGVSTGGKPDLITKEILNLSWFVPIPTIIGSLQAETEPNLPWAEDHFQERVSRVPSNPGDQYKNWPWWHGQDEPAQKGAPYGKFTHTYQERFWPKHAGTQHREWGTEDPKSPIPGIRYDYGDLDDVVGLLRREPYTRQATFPIFFPEDTGAVHGGRIPCTLHYHFMLRDNRLHLWYAIRSCDAVRHFRDDLYMACRLCQWVLEELVERELRSDSPQLWVDVNPGYLYFTAYSFHVHMGDYYLL